MKRNPYLLFASVFINLLFIPLTLSLYLKLRDKRIITKINDQRAKIDYNLTSHKNFNAVFLNRNDSLYKRLWNEAFENEPENAFLISCAYYYVTKKDKVLMDINVSNTQLKDIYYKEVIINLDTSNKDVLQK